MNNSTPNAPTAPEEDYAAMARWFDADADRANKMGENMTAAGVDIKGASKPMEFEADGSVKGTKEGKPDKKSEK